MIVKKKRGGLKAGQIHNWLPRNLENPGSFHPSDDWIGRNPANNSSVAGTLDLHNEAVIRGAGRINRARLDWICGGNRTVITGGSIRKGKEYWERAYQVCQSMSRSGR